MGNHQNHTRLVCNCKVCFWQEGGWSVHAPKPALILHTLYAQQCCLCHTPLACLIVVNCTPESFSPHNATESSKTNVLMWGRQSVGFETLSTWMTFSRSCCKSAAANWVTEPWVCRSRPFPCELNVLSGAPGCRRSPECYLLLCVNSSITRNLWERGWLTENMALCCKIFWSPDV